MDANNATDNKTAGAYPLPFDRAQLRLDIVDVLLTLVRQMNFVFGEVKPGDLTATQRALLCLGTETMDLNSPDVDAQSLGLTFEHIRATRLAEALELLYGYAFEGVEAYMSAELEDESLASWVSRILVDLSRSHFVAEWEAYSDRRYTDAMARCLVVCETAQARRVLEGHDDNFMDWAAPRDADWRLTIRQMALLSGMSEASVRTLANPKRRNALVTTNDGKTTYVLPADAKEWLRAKGRYVPIRSVDPDALDLAAMSFESVADLAETLHRHVIWLASTSSTSKQELAQVAAQLVSHQRADDGLFANPERLRSMASQLRLPGPLLVLRAAEAAARDQLRRLAREIALASTNANDVLTKGDQP